MSTIPSAERPRLIVAPPTSAAFSVGWLRIVPAWIASAVVHAVLLFLFLQVTLGDVAAEASEMPQITTDVVEEPPEPDLTEIEIGTPGLPPGLDLERMTPEPSVRAPVDVHAEVGAPARAALITGIAVAPSMATAETGAGVLAFTGVGIGSPFTGGANLAGRYSGASRDALLKGNGGGAASEAAVGRGLLWLALHQTREGRWTLHDFCRHARAEPTGGGWHTCKCGGHATRQNDIAATAFGLLPFLGAGVSHRPANKNDRFDYSKTVAAGLNYLRARQGRDGYFGGDMYGHGLAAIAMCEAFGLTSDPGLRASAQRALDYIVQAQDPAGGGWRYTPRAAGDLSVTGWQLMALKSGQMSGLAVPADAIKKCERFLDACESTNKGGYSYTPGSGETPTMTAVGLLCRQYLGTNPRNPGLLAGVERLKKSPPGATKNRYYEYYATQVLFHMGGESWTFWNLGPDGTGRAGLRDQLIASQEQEGHRAGSWDTRDAGFAPEGGRLMATSLSLLMLEVYYRHLPLYRRELGVAKQPQ